MAAKQRVSALVLAAVALALTVTGVVLAATDANPGGLAKDTLRLNGYPPKTADLAVTLTSGSTPGLSANVSANFTTNRVEGIVRFPLVITIEALDVRLAAGHLFARPAIDASGPWFTTSLKTPSLFGVALEMTKPDVNLISGFTKTVAKSGYLTTYTYDRDHVALSSLFGAKTTSTLGSIHWTITVGSQGELTQSAITVRTKRQDMTLTVKVLSYNQPVTIAVPATSERKPLSGSFIEKLLKAENVATILVPKSLLGSATVS